MSIRHRQFERTASRLVRREIAKSSRLQLGLKSLESIPTRSIMVLMRGIHPALLLIISVLPWLQKGITVTLVSMSVPLAAFAMFYAPRWIQSLYNLHDITVLIQLPIDDTDIWRAQLQRKRLPIFSAFLTLALVYLAIATILGANLWIVAVIAVVQAIVVFSLILLLAAYSSSAVLSAAGLWIMTGWCVFSIVFPETLDKGATLSFLAILPTAWPPLFSLSITGDVESSDSLFIVPIAIVAAIAPQALRRIRGCFLWVLHYAFSAPSQTYEDRAQPDSKTVPVITSDGFVAFGPTALIDATLSGESLAPPEFHAIGTIEKAFAGWLRGRENLVAGFIWPNGTRWTRSWEISSILILACAILTLVIHREKWPLVFAGVAFLSGVIGLATHRHSPSSSLFLGFPIAYDDLVRVIAKANLVRSIFAVPVWVTYGAFVTFFVKNTFLLGGIIGFKLWLIVLLLQPYIILCWLADSSSMTKKGSQIVMFVVLLTAFFALPLIGAIVLYFRLPIYWSLAVVVAAASFGALLLHRQLYRKGYIDCIRAANT